MLDERKKKVLQAIIEEYINTAEPVSSNALVHKYDLDYSSATIRNEMAELEQIGLLDKPHASAGRVPSVKGYRFYVDELLKDDNISREEMKYIKSKLQEKVNELEDLTKIVTNTLAEVTHYTSLAIGPKGSMQRIADIKFVLLGENILMAVILTDGGLIKETIIKFDEPITQSQIESVNKIFNAKLRGYPLAKIDKPMEEFIISEMSYQINIIKPIIAQINKELDKDEFYLEGANKVFNYPEFEEIELAKNFLNLLDTREVVTELLSSGISEDVNIYIGSESKNENLKDLSIITFRHTFNGRDLGTIGIIGPTRMDYSKVVSIMKYINRFLGDINR